MIVALVSNKLLPEQLPDHGLVPKTVNGMVTDVVEIGEIKALDAESLESEVSSGRI